MKLEEGKVFRYCVGEDIELSKEYEYYTCIGEKEEYYILHEFEKYCTLNGMDSSTIDDLDDYFCDVPELDIKYYKKINSLESIYNKHQEVEVKPKKTGRKFVKV